MLVQSHHEAESSALDRIRWNLPQFRGQSDEQIATSPFTLDDALLVVARLHHFATWADLTEYGAQMDRGEPTVTRFEHAVDAIVGGYLDTLRELVTAQPELVHQRSTRMHHCTLLHYVSANGVEDYRQLTPPNILDITRLLLDAGAEVDATSDSYGGGSTTLGLVSTSAHPRARGVQIALIDILLGYGARIDGEDTLPTLVRNALANGCPEAAVALASRGESVNTLYAASGAGELTRVQALFEAATTVQREHALIVAAQQGHEDVVTYLLDRGVDVRANHGMTALHNAGAGGHTGLMALLLVRGANIEALNEYGGTVLASTLWFAQHVTDAEFLSRDLLRSVEWLLKIGARTDVYPELALEIARVRERASRLTDEHDANLLDGH